MTVNARHSAWESPWQWLGAGALVAFAFALFSCLGDSEPGSAEDIEQQQALSEFAAEMVAAMEGCEAITRVIKASLDSGDRIVIAGLGEGLATMSQACKGSWLTLDDLEVPEALTGHRAYMAREIQSDCKTEMFSRGDIAEQMYDVTAGAKQGTLEMHQSIQFVFRNLDECRTAIDRLPQTPIVKAD